MTSNEIATAIVIIMIGALAFLCYFISFIIRCNNIGKKTQQKRITSRKHKAWF